MRNGDGLRVVLFVSGCQFNCPGCQNPQTWEVKSGIQFDEEAKKDIFEQLEKDYISGITFSGGDPLNIENAEMFKVKKSKIKASLNAVTGEPAIISFIDDDCYKEDSKLLYPEIKRLDIPYSIACPLDNLSDPNNILKKMLVLMIYILL